MISNIIMVLTGIVINQFQFKFILKCVIIASFPLNFLYLTLIVHLR